MVSLAKTQVCQAISVSISRHFDKLGVDLIETWVLREVGQSNRKLAKPQ